MEKALKQRVGARTGISISFPDPSERAQEFNKEQGVEPVDTSDAKGFGEVEQGVAQGMAEFKSDAPPHLGSYFDFLDQGESFENQNELAPKASLRLHRVHPCGGLYMPLNKHTDIYGNVHVPQPTPRWEDRGPVIRK